MGLKHALPNTLLMTLSLGSFQLIRNDSFIALIMVLQLTRSSENMYRMIFNIAPGTPQTGQGRPRDLGGLAI